MFISFSVLALLIALILSFVFGSLNFWFWRAQREDNTSLWMVAFLSVSAIFTLCRLLQYAHQVEQVYILVPRILLTAVYPLAWIAYEIGNSFVNYRPSRWERGLIILLVALPVLFLWVSDLVLTDQTVSRTVAFGGEFTGVLTGSLYLPISILILVIDIVPVVRLLRASNPHKLENRLMAAGLSFLVIFSLADLISTASNLNWIRLSDFSYLPVAILFSYIQAKKVGRLYGEMNLMVNERTEKLSQANETLRASEERYRKLIHTARDVIFTLSMDGTFTSLNPSFEMFTGWSRDEWLGRPFDDLILREDRPHVHDLFNRVLQAETLRAIRLHVPTLKGEKLVVELNISPQIEDNKVVGLLGIARDMTEEQRTEDALRESEEKFRKAFKTSPDSININRLLDGLFLEINEGFTALTGYTAEDVKGKTSLEIDIWADPADRARLVQGLQEHGEVTNLEATFRMKNGQVRLGLMSARVIQVAGETCILSITRDVTELKRAEEEIRLRAEEMTALYEITHDLVMEQDLSKLLYTLVERAAGLLGASGGGMYLCEPDQRQLRCVVSYNTVQDYTGTVLKYGEGAAGLIAETGDSLIVDDYRTWEGRASVYESDHPFMSLLSVPITWQDQIIGVLHVLENSKVSAFVQKDLELLTLFANQAAVAIENSHLFKAEQQRRVEADVIAEISRDISSTLQLDTLLERIVVLAKDLLNAESSAVYLHERSEILLHAIVATGPDAEEIKKDPLRIGEGILGQIAKQKVGEIVNDSAADPRGIKIAGTENIPHEHLMGVPVLSGDNLVGLIAVWRVGEEVGFKQTELDFLSRLAGQIAVVIENARLFEAEQKRRQEADTLREAAQKITSTLDQEQAIQLTLEQLAKVVQFESASIQLFKDGYLEVVGGQGWPDSSEVLGVRFPVPGDNPNTIVVLERRPVVLSNASRAYATFTTPPHAHIQSWLGVPLIVRDRVIGMFAVDHTQPDFFIEADLQMVNAFAAQAAIVIENARLFEETEKRLREAEAISQVGFVLSQTLELEPLLEDILETMIKAIPVAERGSTLLADEEGNLHVRAVWGYTDPRVLGFRFPPRSGYAALCFREHRPILVPDVRADDAIRYDGEIPEMLSGGSAMAAPLIVKDRVIGVLALDTPSQVNAFDDSNLYLLRTIASSTALAIENARLFENTRRRLAEIEAVHTVSTALRSAQTFDEALPIILNQLMELLNAGSALVDLLDSSTQEIVTELAYGEWAPMTGLRTPMDVGGSSRVISTGQPYITEDLLADGMVAHPDLIGELDAAACVPVIAQHQPIGTLWVGRKTPVLEEEVSLLEAVGEMVGNAIHRMRLHERTQTLLGDLQVANRELFKAYDTTLEGWAKALELRDKETEGHSRRVTDLTLDLARQLGVPETELPHIYRGVLLHDIGKMGITDNILNKTGPLDEDEWVEMRKHPLYAYKLLHPITFLRPALDIPYCHHERWDGSGYPRGLKGEEIPLAARVFAVVDVWDALINDRPYRKAWTEAQTLDYLKEHRGVLFDPQVVDKFLTIIAWHEF